jgi:hypothetical protein
MTPISTMTILANSMRTLVRRWPVLLTLYGLTFLLVLPVVLAFRSTLASALLGNPDTERLLEGFSFTMYTDFMSSNRGAVDLFQRTAGPYVLVSIILHGIFGAGVVAAMAGEGSVAEFMKAAGLYLSRSIRLVLYAVTVGGLFLVIWAFALGAVWNAMTSGPAIEPQYLTAAIVVVSLFLLPVAVLSLATEYGRVMIVRENRRSVFVSLLEGFRFVFRHPVRMFFQHGVILLMMTVFVILYWLIEAEIGMTTVGGIVAMLLIQQASIILRVGVRAWHTASAVALVDALTPEVPLSSTPSPASVVSTASSTQPEIIQSAPLPVAQPEKQPVRRKKALGVRRTVKRPVRRRTSR